LKTNLKVKRQNFHIVVIGNGIAGNTSVAAIRKINKETSIAMVSQESLPEYSACALSKKYISGRMKINEVFLKNFGDYLKENVETFFGKEVIMLDTIKREVILKDHIINYEKLIIATGGKPIIPSIQGVDKKGIFTLKSLEDAQRILNHSRGKVVVIGAGAIGIEASIGLQKTGCQVFLVELMDQVLPNLFDNEMSSIITKRIEDYGIEVLTKQTVVKFNTDGHVLKVITDKREIECNMVILALGIRPNVEFAQKAGIEIGSLGGIKVNGQMMTNVEDVYACGDCVETKDIITGRSILCLQWYNAKQQGEIAGYNLVGIPKIFHGAMNILVINLFDSYCVSIGHSSSTLGGSDLRILEGFSNKCYYKLVFADNMFVGAQWIGAVSASDIGVLVSLIRRRDNVKRIKKVLSQGNFVSRSTFYFKLNPYLRGL
jgi:NADH oxidase (H2O2-forming)